jgi:hypothetical protein
MLLSYRNAPRTTVAKMKRQLIVSDELLTGFLESEAILLRS